MPQSTPDKNAFLNVQTIDGFSVQSSDHFRNGYIVAKDGITIGLTESNTAVISFTKLSLGPKSTDPRDWSQVKGRIAVDRAECTTGAILIDTGVDQMYVTLPLGTLVHRSDPPLLDNGSAVDIQVRAEGIFIASESFTVGDAAGIRSSTVPSSVRLTLADPLKKQPFVNTGRHFLRD